MNQGLILSLITVFIWGVDAVASRYIVSTLNVNPMIFATASIFVAAGVLIVIAGPGSGGLKTIKSYYTWAYGLFQILMNLFDIFSFIYITSTESNLLARFGIILSLAAVWLVMNRKPLGSDLLGSLVIMIGIGWVAWSIPAEVRTSALLCVFLMIACGVARTLIAEIHPESVAAKSVKDRCRVTGYVLVVTSFSLTLMLLAIASLKENATLSPEIIGVMNLFPDLQDFVHLPTLASSILFGLTIFPVGAYYYFYSAKVAKTETFMMVSAFMPVVTYGCEYVASLFGLLDISSLTRSDFYAGGLIISGAMFMIFMRHVKH